MPLEWIKDDETVKVDPDEFSPDAFICTCGDIVPNDDIIEVPHRFQGIKALIPRCPACAQRSLCSMNLYGIHGKVVTPDDDDFSRDVVLYDPYPPPAPGQFFRYLTSESLPFPNDHQYGYCLSCGQPMRWDVQEQRWVDWPEARKAPRR